MQSPVQTLKRYISLRSHVLHTLPIVVLMPHSACNCRCVMCDIWKGNRNSRQLTTDDISGLLISLKKLNTRRVLMSGGEALLNRNFFVFCEMLRARDIRITLLSTGITTARYADDILKYTDETIFSLDGDEELHDHIRNIDGAFQSLKDSVAALRSKPGYRITFRSVIHRLNFRKWDKIILAAKSIGADQVSFLPADVTSQAFNRNDPWPQDRQNEIMLSPEELPALKEMSDRIIKEFAPDFSSRFIAESPGKINDIWLYYRALLGQGDFPSRQCNAPWVSAVVEADGTVRPCFFHDAVGNIRKEALHSIINHKSVVNYRRELDVQKNDTCKRCVCSLKLDPSNGIF